MDKKKKKIIEGWMDKDANQLERARDHLNAQMQFSECVQACQQCIELSIKSVLSALDIQYSRGNG
jgi:HEPN domain-containing protein